MKFCKIVREISGNFTFQPDEAGIGPFVFFLLSKKMYRLYRKMTIYV